MTVTKLSEFIKFTEDGTNLLRAVDAPGASVPVVEVVKLLDVIAKKMKLIIEL